MNITKRNGEVEVYNNESRNGKRSRAVHQREP